MLNFSKVAFTTTASGFKNYASKDFSVSVPAQNLAAGNAVFYTASTTLDNTKAISQVQVRYTNLEPHYRVVQGETILRYPNYSTPDFEVGSIVYFSGGVLNVFTYVANQTGGTVAVPAFTITCRAFLFLAPFN